MSSVGSYPVDRFAGHNQRRNFLGDKHAMDAAKVFTGIELRQHPPIPAELDQATGRNGLPHQWPAKADGTGGNTVAAVERPHKRRAESEKKGVVPRLVVPNRRLDSGQRRTEVDHG